MLVEGAVYACRVFTDFTLVFHVYAFLHMVLLLVIEHLVSDSICLMSSTTPRKAAGSALRTTTAAAGSQNRPMPMPQIRRGHRQTKQQQLLLKIVRERDTLHASFFSLLWQANPHDN
jgi:hypothetical protein